MGALAERASLPIHAAKSHEVEGLCAFQNTIYCRSCRHKLGDVYGAISAGFCGWRFCPYCGVEITPTNPYHQPVEIVWQSDGWNHASWPDVLDGVIEGRANERRPIPPFTLSGTSPDA